jgi:hypothetical protein
MGLRAAHGRTLWLCLFAVLAASAVACSCAGAALPSYSNCVAIEGPFTSATCHHLGPPDTWAVLPFEFGPEHPNTSFEAHAMKDDVRVETTSLTAITCQGGRSDGHFAGSKEQQSVFLSFTGCRLGTHKCASAGQGPGKIVTSPLQGVLGYLAGKGTGAPTVGLSLSAETGPLLEATCAGVGVRLTGAVVGTVTRDIDFINKISTESFVQSAGVQEFTSFEGGAPGEQELSAEIDMGGGYQPAGPAGLQLSERVQWPMLAEIEA